jgi:hypothetical protein
VVSGPHVRVPHDGPHRAAGVETQILEWPASGHDLVWINFDVGRQPPATRYTASAMAIAQDRVGAEYSSLVAVVRLAPLCFSKMIRGLDGTREPIRDGGGSP